MGYIRHNLARGMVFFIYIAPAETVSVAHNSKNNSLTGVLLCRTNLE